MPYHVNGLRHHKRERVLLVNAEPFTTFQEFLERRDMDPDTFASVTCAVSKATRWAALGEQRRFFPQTCFSMRGSD